MFSATDQAKLGGRHALHAADPALLSAPPGVPMFLVSVVPAVLAVLAAYGHMSIFNASYAFVALLIAYGALLAGILFRGV